MRSGSQARTRPRRRLVPMLLIPFLLVGGVLPVAAQDASPAASPAASPVGDGEAGWRVADERRLELDGEPVALSPDGQWVAGRGPEREFCLWEVATLDATCEGQDLAIRPESIAWAPDSSAVAFSLEAAKFLIDSDIYLFEVDAGELRNLTDDGVDEVDLFGDELEEPLLIDDVPAWSPDSQSLVFARSRWVTDGLRGTTVVRIDRDGGETDTLFSVDLNLPFAVYFPMQWLEGDRLLYTVLLPDNDDERNGLYISDLDGSDDRLLVPGDSASEVPGPWVTDVAPDGASATLYSALKFGQFGGEAGVFHLVDLERGALTPIETGEEPEARIGLPPTLSPDGQTLLFTVSTGGERLLAVQDIATGDLAILSDDVEFTGVVGFRGLDWAANDTVFIPFGDASLLLTLERID